MHAKKQLIKIVPSTKVLLNHACHSRSRIEKNKQKKNIWSENNSRII